MSDIRPVQWTADGLEIIDQTQLPFRFIVERHKEAESVARAIKDMKVRGAPAIGIAAAYGIALEAQQGADRQQLLTACQMMRQTRPTAVNLFAAMDRIEQAVREGKDVLAEAHAVAQEDLEADLRMAELGADLIPPNARALTICNTGALATGGYGTAYGILRKAYETGKLEIVYACETRPRLQGMRLTAWELARNGIPFRVISDGMAGWLMSKRMVDFVIAGADRIAANGDTANKIGTYSLATLAHAHGLPFYIAAPTTTIDSSTPDGNSIPIEERSSTEVTHIDNVQIAPDECPVWNPAFDVTPARLITAIVTEQAVCRPPYRFG